MPNTITAGIKSLFTRGAHPPPGLHHYLQETPEAKNRIHLRIDPDGHGTLIINANSVIHLNPTAAFMTYLFLEETPLAEALRAIIKRYHVTPDQAQAVHAFVRQKLASTFGSAAAQGLRILYGGSVKPGNAGELLAQPDIDGALVGGACLVADDFTAIISAAAGVAASA